VDALIAKIYQELKFAERTYEINSSLAKLILLFPIVISFLYGLSLVLPITRGLALWMQEENRPIELLTFGFLLAGGIRGLVLAWQSKIHREEILVYGFYAVFSIGFLFTAMEEIAWGQWFFGFDTPSALKSINVQGEFTVHNIRGLHGQTEFVRVAFGLGGLLGVWLSSRRHFRQIGAPFILASWFLIISIHAVPDLYIEYFSIERRFDKLISNLAEFVEMMIGMSGFLFIWLNARMLAAKWRDDVS